MRTIFYWITSFIIWASITISVWHITRLLTVNQAAHIVVPAMASALVAVGIVLEYYREKDREG